MRIRVTWPDGNQREGTIRTWRELRRFVEGDGGAARRPPLVAVAPEGDGFHVRVLPE